MSICINIIKCDSFITLKYMLDLKRWGRRFFLRSAFGLSCFSFFFSKKCARHNKLENMAYRFSFIAGGPPPLQIGCLTETRATTHQPPASPFEEGRKGSVQRRKWKFISALKTDHSQLERTIIKMVCLAFISFYAYSRWKKFAELVEKSFLTNLHRLVMILFIKVVG